MKTDYPELEGRTIIVFGTKCIVVGVNYHVGITVVAEHNKNLPFICLINKIHRKEFGYKIYRKLFHEYIKAIKVGQYTEYDSASLKLIYDGNNRSNPNIKYCPWR